MMKPKKRQKEDFFPFIFTQNLAIQGFFMQMYTFWNIHMQMRLQPLLLGKYTAASAAEKKLIIWKEYCLIYVPSSVLKFFCQIAFRIVKEWYVFCFKNCFDQLWEKIVIVIEIFFWKFEAQLKEFAKLFRTLIHSSKNKRTILERYHIHTEESRTWDNNSGLNIDNTHI